MPAPKRGRPRMVRRPAAAKSAMVALDAMFALVAFKNVPQTRLVAIFVMTIVRVCVSAILIFIMLNMFAVMAFMLITRAVTETTRRIIPVSVTV